MPSRRARVAPCAVVMLLLAGVSCSGGALHEATSDARPEGDSTDDSGDSGDPSSLEWSGCDDELAAAADLECATLEVPLDPSDPDGDTIELALARKPSSGSESERIGSLLFNPGGPGGSGIEALANLTAVLPEELGERFDLVSWDPRGVAASSPVRCLVDDRKDAQIEGDLSPDTTEELDRAIADQAELRQGCESENPELVQLMSTADVAADLDAIRAALGDDQLNYVGFSYGTAIGATYATMFPERVRAMVLDGSVSPLADPTEQALAQVAGFESAYGNFVAACDADPACPLTGGAAARVQAVRTTLDTAPVEVSNDSGTRALGRDQFDIGLATAFYDSSVWGILAEAIAGIERGEPGGAEVLMAFADTQLGRQADGTWDNSIDSRAMVNCLDQEWRPTLQEATALGEQVRASAPTFGDAFVTTGLGCLDWPTATNPRPELTGAGAAPILVIGTEGDPATPWEWSRQMADALESATLLTYEGDGHTAFTRAGACVDDAVVRYLVDLELPAEGTSCPATPPASGSSFGGVEALLTEQLTEAGLDETTASCMADAMVAEVGTNGLALMLLQQDIEAQTELATRASMSCLGGG